MEYNCPSVYYLIYNYHLCLCTFTQQPPAFLFAVYNSIIFATTAFISGPKTFQASKDAIMFMLAPLQVMIIQFLLKQYFYPNSV